MLLVAGIVLTGAYQGVGATVSGCIAVCQGKTNALIHIAACLPFNVVFVLLGMFLQPRAAVVLCALLPLLSALSFKVFLVRGTNDKALASVEKPCHRSAMLHKPDKGKRYGGYVLLLLLITAAFGFVQNQVASTVVDGDGGVAPLFDYASLFIRGICALAVFFGYVLYSRQPQTFLVIAIALMGAGLLTLGLVGSWGSGVMLAANLLVAGGYAVFDLLIWAILVIVHHGSPLPMRQFLCAAYALDELGIFLGMVLAAVLPTQSPWNTLCAGVLGGALLAAAFVVLGRPNSVRADLGGTPFDEGDGRFDVTVGSDGRMEAGCPEGRPMQGKLTADKSVQSSHAAEHPEPSGVSPLVDPRRGAAAQVLGARYFLSAREEVVLGLLLEGRSAPYIAEQLCVSQNTVKTHVRHIYAKLDVHNRQEMIDLVQREAQA